VADVTFQVLTREEVEAKRELQVQHRPSGAAIEIAEQQMAAARPRKVVVTPEPWYTREGARGRPMDERFIIDDDVLPPEPVQP